LKRVLLFGVLPVTVAGAYATAAAKIDGEEIQRNEK